MTVRKRFVANSMARHNLTGRVAHQWGLLSMSFGRSLVVGRKAASIDLMDDMPLTESRNMVSQRDRRPA